MLFSFFSFSIHQKLKPRLIWLQVSFIQSSNIRVINSESRFFPQTHSRFSFCCQINREIQFILTYSWAFLHDFLSLLVYTKYTQNLQTVKWILDAFPTRTLLFAINLLDFVRIPQVKIKDCDLERIHRTWISHFLVERIFFLGLMSSLKRQKHQTCCRTKGRKKLCRKPYFYWHSMSLKYLMISLSFSA